MHLLQPGVRARTAVSARAASSLRPRMREEAPFEVRLRLTAARPREPSERTEQSELHIVLALSRRKEGEKFRNIYGTEPSKRRAKFRKTERGIVHF